MSVYRWPVGRTIYWNNFYRIYSLNRCSYLSNGENHISISCLVFEWHHFQENIFLFSDFEEINTFNLNVKYIYKIDYFLKNEEIKIYYLGNDAIQYLNKILRCGFRHLKGKSIFFMNISYRIWLNVMCGRQAARKRTYRRWAFCKKYPILNKLFSK